MGKTLVPLLVLSGCAGVAFQERSVVLAEVSPGRDPRWVQSSADGRVVAFTEVAGRGADRVVVTGRPTGTYHFL